jgi:hypothetical protein
MRIACTGPVGDTGGVPGMGLLMLRELLGQGVEVELCRITHSWAPSPIEPMPRVHEDHETSPEKLRP